ncbi:MAG: hypothetical protein ACI8TQ_003062 [Planctomycetota bacterium]|jgi:hypothetical protein
MRYNTTLQVVPNAVAIKLRKMSRHSDRGRAPSIARGGGKPPQEPFNENREASTFCQNLPVLMFARSSLAEQVLDGIALARELCNGLGQAVG